jgi:hypothetical protein
MKSIYKSNLKCQAEWLGCKDQVVSIKMEGRASALAEATLVKVDNVS